MTERKLEGIYGILPADVPDEELLKKAEAAMNGGVRLLQLRDKKAGFKRALRRANALRELTQHYDTRLLVNDSVQLAVESGADGVHLGMSDLQSLTQLRNEVGPEMLIGVSCKADAAFAMHVLGEGADYVSFGAVFPTTTKSDAAPIGLPRLAKARQMFPDANICAIGGISLDTLRDIRRAGADCAAVISSLFNSADIEVQAQAMMTAWQQG